MASQDDKRPPFVSFEIHEVEDRPASQKAGRYMTKDVHMIIIIPHGSEGKTRIVERYDEWLKKIEGGDWAEKYAPGTQVDGMPMMAARFEQSWVDRIKQAYANWVNGVVMTVEGTPVQNWPAISPAQRTACINAHLLTVEQLASASDQAIDLLGMGGRTLQLRAQEWVKARDSDPGKISAQMEALRVAGENKDVRIESLTNQLGALKAQLEALTAKA